MSRTPTIWMNPDGTWPDTGSTPKNAEIEAQITSLGTYDRITVETDDNQGKYALKGLYRARVVNEKNPNFDPKGSAIWVTTDQGFEAFIPIAKISKLEVTEPYSPREAANAHSMLMSAAIRKAAGR